MGNVLERLGEWLARYLAQPSHVHSTAPATRPDMLKACLQPADVLLVEGTSRISTAIKYLTQSTWSHAAVYIGERVRTPGAAAEPCFVEADVVEGVRMVGLEEFVGLHTRLCRASGLDEAARDRVVAYLIDCIGHKYDLRNVLDLARYLLPTPPVPLRFRRRMLMLGSGEPTRAICSTLAARAFQSVQFPILPMITEVSADAPDCPGCVAEIYKAREASFFVPRDFDVSPYFEVIKPSLHGEFKYKEIVWAGREGVLDAFDAGAAGG
jgi:hypothetical protein